MGGYIDRVRHFQAQISLCVPIPLSLHTPYKVTVNRIAFQTQPLAVTT